MLDFHGLLKRGDVSLLVGVQQTNEKAALSSQKTEQTGWGHWEHSLSWWWWWRPSLDYSWLSFYQHLSASTHTTALRCFFSSLINIESIPQFMLLHTYKGDGFSFVVLVKSWAIHIIRTLLNLFSPGFNNILVSWTVKIYIFSFVMMHELLMCNIFI